jgi:hypothetical protein
MNSTIESIIRVLMYVLLLTGMWLFLGRHIVRFIREENKAYRFKARSIEKPDNKFTAHIKLLIRITTGNDVRNSVFYFLFFSAFLFFISFTVTTGLFGVSIFFILISALIGLLPYIYLRFKLKSLQLAGSYEAEELLSELTSMYKISDFNMASAIDKTVENIKVSPLSKKALFILSVRIKDYKDINELKSAVDFFVSMFGTEWAVLLGMSIFESIANGTNVAVSLDGILSNLKEIKSSIEKDKRANYEAFTMVKFVIPIIYILSVFTCVKYFGFTLGKFFYYQFNTALGIKFFMAIAVLSVIGFWSMYILSRPKFDF